MIQLDAQGTLLEQAIQSIDGLKTLVQVVDESHLRERISDLNNDQFPVLVSMIPSGTRDNVRDQNNWRNIWMFYVLQRVDRGDTKYADQLQNFVTLQRLALQFIEFMSTKADEGCSILKNFSGGADLDPEYNFQECDGWSLTLNIQST